MNSKIKIGFLISAQMFFVSAYAQTAAEREAQAAAVANQSRLDSQINAMKEAQAKVEAERRSREATLQQEQAKIKSENEQKE